MSTDSEEPPSPNYDVSAPRHSDPALQRLLDVAFGGIVLIVYVVVQLVLLQGPHPHDPAKYFTTAVHFPDVPANLWTLRIGLIGPVRGAVMLLGPSEAALYAVPIAAGVLLALAAYATMLVLFTDRVVAAAAALVTVLNANYQLNSSFIFPDTVATATLTTGFLFLILGGERLDRNSRTWIAPAAALCAGVLFGWSYLIREFSPVLLPAVVIALVLLHYRWRRLALLATGAVATASLELLYGLLKYNNPFVHIDELVSHGGDPFSSASGRAERIQGQLESPFDSLLVLPRLVLAWQGGWIMLLLVVILVTSAAWLRDWRLWLLASWCFAFWAVMIIFGAVTLPSGRWILNVTNVRYWYPLFPPLVMGAFGGLYLLIRRLLPTARGVAVGQLVAVSLSAVALVPGFIEFDRCADRDVWTSDPSSPWRELRSWFATSDARPYDVVYANTPTYRVLPAFVRSTFGRRTWEGKLREFPDFPERLIRENSAEEPLILINKRWFPNRRLEDLRAEWFPRFVSDDGMMVVLARISTSEDQGDLGNGWWLPPEGRSDPQSGCGLSPY